MRAFVDYMVEQLNKTVEDKIEVVIVKPINVGNLDSFKAQNNKYHVILRGVYKGRRIEETVRINCISKVLCAYNDYNEFISEAHDENLKIIVSNTTEAGISLSNDDSFSDTPPKSFPAKLTKLLHERYEFFHGDKEKGLYLLPCELIQDNADKLLECILETSIKWGLGNDFMNWVKEANVFCNTLVDRIVTGFVPELSEKYNDRLIDICEPFGLWVIQNKGGISDILPLDKAGLPVIFAGDVTPYRQRKVKVLNGAHTSTVLLGYLCHKKIVRECMGDKELFTFMKRCVFHEIIPTIDMGKDELDEFANDVFERFSNPFIDHSLLSIALNSVSKWKARILDSLKEYVDKIGTLPVSLAFSMSALIAFYLGNDFHDCESYEIKDDLYVITLFSDLSGRLKSGELTTGEIVSKILIDATLWGEDLTKIEGFSSLVTKYLNSILNDGAIKAVVKFNAENL